ncbi:MAG: hypothetical protein KGI55_11015 [Gammaproteobacteria bacterium]|nr:hypothetical protein [Gammaproteobacteria bacterium]
MSKNQNSIARRAFVTGAGAATAALAAAAGRARAGEADSPPARWQPTFENLDAWMDLPGRHRFVFDCASATGAGDGVEFADAYFRANQSGYQLAPSDLAVILILRHYATVFAYDDRIWAKYGAEFSKMLKFTDPKTKAAPVRNVYLNDEESDPEKKDNKKENTATLAALAQKGVHFAVCGLATQGIADHLAGKDKARTADIHAELVAAMIPNGHLTAAGIVALNRTQEHGYAIAHMG